MVRLADRVAYINHDLDDAMRGGIVQPEDVPAIVRERVGERNSVRINSILTDIIAHSGDGELRMSPDMREAVDVFTTFTYEGVYYNPIAKGEERKVQNILGSIWGNIMSTALPSSPRSTSPSRTTRGRSARCATMSPA